MIGTEIFIIDAPWAEKLTKTRVSFLMNPSVYDSRHSSQVPSGGGPVVVGGVVVVVVVVVVGAGRISVPSLL